ncbi:MAG: hypothetical protein GXY14_02970 [Spirochaetes bacterium]|nr:hypothetical protein [Spirochaetota bacterium]
MKKRIYSLVFVLLMGTGAFAGDVELETIGSSIASNLYLTYISLGVLGDSFTKEVYDKEQTINLASIIVSQSKVQKEQMARLIKSIEVQESDKEFIKSVITCYQYLIDEGTFMIDFINTNNEESLKKYDENRQKAWALISNLLGFENN